MHDHETGGQPAWTAVLAAVLCSAAAVGAGAQELPRVSPAAEVTQALGLGEITISYSRPAVRGRQIWGGLVPYGEVWRTGANEATKIRFSEDVVIGGTRLAAGEYSLATIPSPDRWTVIFNRKADLWGAFDYDPDQDAVRIEVEPEKGAHEELLTFRFSKVEPESARVVLAWAELRLPFTVEVATPLTERMQAAVEAADDWRVPYRAARYCQFLGWQLDRGMGWVEESISREANYYNLSLKAELLAAQGKHGEAIAVGERALEAAKSMERQPDTSSMEELLAAWKAGA